MSFQQDVKEAQRQIKATEKAIVNNLDEAAMIPAKLIAQEAKRRAPRASGRLERSIDVEAGDPPAANIGQAIVRVGVFYAGFREFGTRFQTPDPFLRPAADTQEKPGGRAMESFIQGLINQVAK